MRQIDVREDGAARDCGEDGHDQDDDASRDAGQHRGFAKAAAGEQDDGARRGSGDESGFDQEAGREKVRGQDAGRLVSVKSPGKTRRPASVNAMPGKSTLRSHAQF
jgi:hypothetical protein